MSEQYLLIQNPGICPFEGFTVFGLSGTRNCGRDDVIGQFGSGNKHAINLLLRQGVNPVIYLGHKKLCFFTKPCIMNDELGDVKYSKVFVNVDGEVKDLNFSVEYGSLDWKDTSMALREFVSNAIDRTLKEFGNLTNPNLRISVVSDPNSGDGTTTRVFVPLITDVQRFYNELDTWFLHFGNKVARKVSKITDPRKGRVYRNGVLIRETLLPALFDYNFDKTLWIDESRNLSDYQVTHNGFDWLTKHATVEDFEHLFRILIGSGEIQHFFEFSFSSFNLTSDEVLRARMLKAWENVAQGRVLITNVSYIDDFCKRKGYGTIFIRNSNWYEILVKIGAKTYLSVLDSEEIKGKESTAASQDMIDVLDEVWDKLVALKMTRDKQKPLIKQYTIQVEAECTEFGSYAADMVLISSKLATGKSQMLYETVLEEVIHHITGANDRSRDIQEFMLTVIIKQWENESGP